jgi:predicted nucleic acid-binding protein
LSLVLDASVTLAWILPGERTLKIESVLKTVVTHGAVVPELWRIEVANILLVSVRRSRITPVYRDESLEDLNDLAISVDNETNLHAWSRTLSIADKHSLTLYDAAYLELALRLALPLATLDIQLRRAAETEKVQLLGA